jgi:outer membrane protein assembly factor BamB
VKEKSKQNAYLFPERYSVTVQGDRVWSVGRSFDQLGQHGAVFALVGRDKATGKELFNSKNTGAVKEWSLRSSPVFAGDLVYCAASKANEGNQVRVLAFSPKDGKVAWNVQLGTTKFDPDQMYYQRTVHPTLVLREDRLYVDTHCGALLELDAQSGEIRWAVAYDSETPDQNRWWGYRVNNGFVTVGRPLFVEGALYFKGMLSDELLAVQPTGPVVAFRRPVSQTAVLVGVDADRFYTGGDAITAYDLRQRDAKNRPRLAWNRPLPTGTGWVRPLITRSKIYQFTPRGIFEVEKATGDARVFRGADIESLGGALVLAPGVLLTASNGAITAYPILPASPPETAPPATAANP